MYSDIRLGLKETIGIEDLIEKALFQFENSGEKFGCYARKFSFNQYWLPKEPVIQLAIVCLFWRKSDKTSIQFTVIDQLFELEAQLSRFVKEGVDQVLKSIKSPWFELGQPMALQTVSIAKPWGREIWYTGIEERGVARFEQGERSIPIPWIIAVAGKALLGENSSDLVLLKVLDPLPDSVYGDLYFELHEEKQEVYVVTHVDENAWPDKTGYIRFSFCQQRKDQYSNESDFKVAFLGAVEAYESVRREIDDIFDQRRIERGYGLLAPVDSSEQQQWQSELPESLRAKEQDLRLNMESFSEYLPLRVGDVVKVPCFIPHSLQHGVRTVEFQTPVYERKILSFAQKVLTQEHWDTEAAVACMQTDHTTTEAFEVLEKTVHQQVERIVNFEDFEVHRVTLQGGSSFNMPPQPCYRLCLVIKGPVGINDIQYCAEKAVLIPAFSEGLELVNSGTEEVICLVALPH